MRLAQQNPDKQVVFFGIGFETTAPANAMTVLQADRLGLTNFSHAGLATCWCRRRSRRILESPDGRVQALPGRRPRLHA